MLFIPLEFENTRIDALVDLGAYINVISENDTDKIQNEANTAIIAKVPPPPFKIQYANTELEKARATYTMKFKIGDYTFEETFIIMTKTSYPLIGLAFLRKLSTIIDTAQGTRDFPQIQITLAIKDEMQKCNPKPITIKTEEKHSIPAQATRIIHASITVSNDHPITGTVQPLSQFDEIAKLIVAPAITTARDKRVSIKIANTTDFPYTNTPHTNLAELQIQKPEETKSIRAVDPASLNLLTEHDDVVAYVNASMQIDSPEQTEEKFWFPTPEDPGDESEHTPIQQHILRERRQLQKLEELDPNKTKNPDHNSSHC